MLHLSSWLFSASAQFTSSAARVHFRRCTAQSMNTAPLQRVLEVGLIGIPNAGKSELTNHLIGRKITAVSSKKNTTTRCQLGGYHSDSNTQIVLYDLPGVLRSKDTHYRGQTARIEAAWNMAEQCGVVTFIVDSAVILKNLFRGHGGRMDLSMIRAIPVFDLAQQLQLEKHRENSPKIILALNKIDLVSPENRSLLSVVEDLLKERCDFDRSFYISALKGHGLPGIKSYFHSLAQEGDWVLPSGCHTDKSGGELAVELVREQIFRRLNKELPYKLDAELLGEELQESGEMLFKVQIRVPNEHALKIVVGHRGSVVKDYIAFRARKELENTLKRRVSLSVNVKLKR